MINAQEKSVAGFSKWGRRILLAVSGLLALNGVALYLFIADSNTMYTAALMEVGLGLLAMVVAWEGLHQGLRWAWYALWIFVGLLAAITGQLLINGEGEIALWYMALAALALLGQLLAARSVQG